MYVPSGLTFDQTRKMMAQANDPATHPEVFFRGDGTLVIRIPGDPPKTYTIRLEPDQ